MINLCMKINNKKLALNGILNKNNLRRSLHQSMFFKNIKQTFKIFCSDLEIYLSRSIFLHIIFHTFFYEERK